jgi:hypothetical protein
MAYVKAANILLCLIAIACVIASDGTTDSKIIVSAVFTIVIMFWLCSNSPKIEK